ncbi:cellulase family glycosylhydrolase [Serratia liquefaciens]|uniref:cellulase family glycosylhydrolase n=1 Tax=Serratia liquefaciens TaxID=614 RepID=UPI0022DDB6F9|nr:cellulase family glycosylhydrolase [Serratia liquefaciens]WBL72098.1 glycosyl hydrolase [Serratia liquefaciens]
MPIISSCYKSRLRERKIKFFRLGALSILAFSTSSMAFEVGVHTHFRWYPNDPDKYLELVKRYGFTSYRADFPWSGLEQQKGQYVVTGNMQKADQAFNDGQTKFGLNGLLVLAYGNKLYDPSGYPTTPEAINAFANYAYWTASKYKGKIKYYEIWNEWTNSTAIKPKPPKPPAPEVFVALVKATAAAVKKADPDAIIMTGSANPTGTRDPSWVDKIVKLGVLNYVDGLSIHPYSYGNDSYAVRAPEGNLSVVDQFEAKLAKAAGRSVPIYITEIGVPTYEGKGGLSKDLAAQYIVKYTFLAKSRPYIKGVWWYDLLDDGDNPKINEHRFGLLTRDGQPKPSMLAFSKVADIARSYTVEKYQTLPGGKISIALKGNNQHAMLFWQEKPIAQPSNGISSTLRSFINSNTAPQQQKAMPLKEVQGNSATPDGDVPVMMRSTSPINSPW